MGRPSAHSRALPLLQPAISNEEDYARFASSTDRSHVTVSAAAAAAAAARRPYYPPPGRHLVGAFCAVRGSIPGLQPLQRTVRRFPARQHACLRPMCPTFGARGGLPSVAAVAAPQQRIARQQQRQ